MMRGRLIRTLTLPVLSALALAGAATAQERASEGAQLYHAQGCFGCHGFGGVGRTPLDKSRSAILGNEDLFIQFLRLRADQNPILPSTNMPNYPEESLPDEDARTLYGYIISFAHDDPAVEGIPVFQEILEAAEAP